MKKPYVVASLYKQPGKLMMLKDVTDMTTLCSAEDLIPNSGVCALYEGEQIAIFFLPDDEKKVFALGNHDPFSNANVISRGIVGSLTGKKVVASPLYKQHFDLESGVCLEDDSVALKTYDVALLDDQVVIQS